MRTRSFHLHHVVCRGTCIYVTAHTCKVGRARFALTSSREDMGGNGQDEAAAPVASIRK